MQTTDRGVSQLNSLLRGELSAVETYQQAVEKMAGSMAATELRTIQGEHQQAVATLRQHVVARGGEPSTSSGAWGAWANFVEGTASVFGEVPALKALKEGEEHGINDYESALKDDDLEPECKSLIQSTLLPRTRAHIPVLDRLMATR